MPDGFATTASRALLGSWNHHSRIPRAIYASATARLRDHSIYGAEMRMQRLGVFTQSKGHWVAGFGFTVRSNIPSFGALAIHAYDIDSPIRQPSIWYLKVGSLNCCLQLDCLMYFSRTVWHDQMYGQI